MIRQILVYFNTRKDESCAQTLRIVRFLKEQGVSVFMDQERRALHPDLENLTSPLDEERKGNMDLAVVLGGDGTMIRCGHFLQGTGVPLIGINLGTLGYLTEIDPSNPEETLLKAIRGQFRVENRLMLEGSIGDDPTLYTAINDFVIHRDLLDGILTIRCHIGGHFLTEFHADGVIVSSPGGSTAYNYSAGGPILDPVSDNMILTPLCSHAIVDRSIVLGGGEALSFYIDGFTKGNRALFMADGDRYVDIPAKTWIHVRKSRWNFPLAKVSERSFYEIVQMKMRP
ncbi:MAG: NAD(+)/NADH kinase [Firmicutes bacterium]|nr:NAD(+)/NADH kinase [Bacillota bacterium]